MIISIVAAVVILAVLIIVHEAGHFTMAKRLGVRVVRFSVGYPPRIWGIRRGETDYAIGATPLGGYVRMLGDEISDEPSPETIQGYLKEVELDLIGAAKATGWLKASGKEGDDAITAMAAELASDDHRHELKSVAIGENESVIANPQRDTLSSAVPIIGRELKTDEALLLREINKSGSVKVALESLGERRPSALVECFKARAFPTQRLSKRIAIVLAGPIANLIFAPFLMMVVLMVGLPTMLPVIGTVDRNMPAYAAGLRPGDRIVAADGHKMKTWDALSEAVKSSKGALVHLTIERPEGKSTKTIEISLKPKLVDEPTIYGNKEPVWIIGVMPRGDQETQSLPPLEAFKGGFVDTGRMTENLFIGIEKIFAGVTPVRKALGGPIMIAQIAGEEARRGFADVALFTVMLSLELGIINLLPVPLLDGGHLLFFILEGVRGKPIQLRHRELAMEVGLFLLVILMAFVILNDISRIIG